MNKKILAILAILMMTMLPITALAGSTSYSVSIVVAEDTSFTVTITPGLSPPETSLRFSGKPNTNVPATGQTGTRPWAKINNTGDYARNFTAALASVLPTNVVLTAKNTPNVAGGISLGTSTQELPGGHLVPGGGGPTSNFSVWINATYGTATIGTYGNNLVFRNYVPVASNLSVLGVISISIPGGGSVTNTYTAGDRLDQEGQVMGPAADASYAWSLSKAVTGVTIGAGTGVLTVTSSANDDTFDVIVKGSPSNLIGKLTVSIYRPT